MQAVLFDLDGTLTHSGAGVMRSVSYALAACGLEPLSTQRLRSFVGPPLQDSFAALGLTPAGVDHAVERYREYFADRGIFENEVYDGITEVLTVLGQRGVRLAVATSKPTVFAERILDHFDLAAHFEDVVGANLDGTQTRKHEVITEALARLGLQPAVTVMVGDRAQDVEGSARVGVACIGAGWGYANDGELEAAGAACVLPAPLELLAHLPSPTAGPDGHDAGGARSAQRSHPVRHPTLPRAL